MPLDSPYRNPGRWRAVANHQENRHGTAGCLLSLVLLAPLLTPACGVGVVLVAVLIYSCVVVPALANYYSFSRLLLRSVKFLGNGGGAFGSGLYTGLASKLGQALTAACHYAAGGLRVILQCLLMVLLLPFTFVRTFVPLVHNFYLSFEAFRVTSNQMVFFVLAEHAMTPKPQQAALYFLFFYTVLIYLHKTLFRRQWGQNLNSTNLRDFLRLTAWYMAVRLGKGVALSFILVMFTVEFRHGEPQLSYIAATFVYFSITQHKWTGNERVVAWLRSLSLELFEEEEELWVPLGFKAGTVLASVAVAAPLASTWPTLCAVAAYTNVLAPVILLRAQFETQHQTILNKYRRATKEEILAHSTCPVCLETLKVARATPCNHLYHATCLRRCLELSPLCPMCKQTIL
ncbi:uncharacterized protein LOC119576394 isoform X1 [Penaeus monodon]|uniref:uncharacterized protein LOC119576394 isoform X1 n=1 Tax=Penaeus monodon TaxID=6687 RepID=UPI0018A75322|nr:uncharacterized protein LOC119576394 isoform X1 [Penaeus monodon]XP_037779998.1 uncharacterized protein LOC119576394 isoform X1 [Penaeus monodon]XP_037779999.1 uncharacterized protein LOC119576394 isoform X1 [Penaeus monodon]